MYNDSLLDSVPGEPHMYTGTESFTGNEDLRLSSHSIAPVDVPQRSQVCLLAYCLPQEVKTPPHIGLFFTFEAF